MTSDSEEAFESADEGNAHTQKQEKNEKLVKVETSKNLKSHKKSRNTSPELQVVDNLNKQKCDEDETNKKETEGWENDWDDFDVDNSNVSKPPNDNPIGNYECHENKTLNNEDNNKTNVGGWDDFGDWENEDQQKTLNRQEEHSEKEYKELADRLSSMGDSNVGGGTGWGGWGGWGVTNLLTSGVSQLTSHVSQGFASVSHVIESGMGVPDPVELAQNQKKIIEKQILLEKEAKNNVTSVSEKAQNSSEVNSNETVSSPSENIPIVYGDTMGVSKLGKLVSNVTKLVETTGNAVVTGGLDTLEEIGKRTMRVLQGEEDGKKRLSTLLREARDKIEETPPSAGFVESATKKTNPKFESLFDDFQGLVHLEALEMLSKQCDMKLKTLLTTLEGDELSDLKETLDQVKEICELPDSDEDDEKENENEHLSSEILKNKLKESIKDMGVQLQFDAIIKCWDNIIIDATNTNNETEEKFENDEKLEETLIEKAECVMLKAITNLAQSSAISVQLLHKVTALLSVRERRSTADEADGLTQLTAVLTSHIGEIAALYSHKLNEICKVCKNSEKVNGFITNVFLEAGKGSSYIQDAFLLTIPILQVGAT
ncbi:protein FAM114A2 [Arctopsyche grandis]|uniref:protein FAM114A2 n=1 Tax=Arctopsyche grandis TaxID=121162 RepID=UPI00406D8815